jgi:hypothetical protein
MNLFNAEGSMKNVTFRVVAAAVLVLMWIPLSQAAHTLFGFYVEHDGEHYWVQLAGSEDPGAIEFRWPGLPEGVLQGQKVDLEFDRPARRMEMRYVNPGDNSRPPTFRISVQGDSGVLEFEGQQLPGAADWTDSY